MISNPRRGQRGGRGQASRGRGSNRGRGRGASRPVIQVGPLYTTADRTLVEQSAPVLPRRPDFGTLGRHFPVWVNLYPVEFDETLTVFHYGTTSLYLSLKK